MPTLKAGVQDGTTHIFDCFIAPVTEGQGGTIDFKVEMVDQHNQRIVTFVTTSAETH